MSWPTGIRYRPIMPGDWPGKFSEYRPRSKFRASLSDTLDRLQRELDMLDAADIVLQIAVDEADLRIDGMPRARAVPRHPGIILAMNTPQGSLKFPCDTFSTWQENLRAIALTLESLRRINRYGVTRENEQYTGWRAIEANVDGFSTAAEAARWLEANYGDDRKLGLDVTLRRAKRRTHPDSGGDPAEFHRVMKADEVLRQAGVV